MENAELEEISQELFGKGARRWGLYEEIGAYHQRLQVLEIIREQRAIKKQIESAESIEELKEIVNDLVEKILPTPSAKIHQIKQRIYYTNKQTIPEAGR